MNALASYDLASWTGESCHAGKYYLYFLFPSMALFLLGLVVIGFYRLVAYLVARVRNTKELKHQFDDDRVSVDGVLGLTSSANGSLCRKDSRAERLKAKGFNRSYRKVIKGCEKIVSGQSLFGKILMVISSIVILVSIIVYLIDVSFVPPLEREMDIRGDTLRIIDLACNVFFFIYFIPKFLAAYDKLKFWLQWFSIADIFTIPAAFTGLAIGRQWIGLRFMCFLRLLSFPEYFQAMAFLKTANEIRLSEFVIVFFSVWLAAAGFNHLLENSGSPTQCYKDASHLSYFNHFYFMLITMSTVGYGDLSNKTIAGQIFIVIFILLSVALFARFFAEMSEIVSSLRQPYVIEYQKVGEIKHFIVGGSISTSSARNFVEDFTHADRVKNNFKSIFFQNKELSPEIITLFKRHYTKIGFIKGSLMEPKDLDRIKLKDAVALIIMTDETTSTPDEEDTSNIMKAISCKTYCPSTRVILQLIKQENKSMCYNLPFWSSQDQIICLTEINMGFMAAGCLAPGFATLLTNLLLPVSSEKSPNREKWQNEYMKGVEMEVYAEKFSSFFHGRSLDTVVSFCYKRLKLLLVGVSNVKDKNGLINPRLILNPGPKYFINEKSVGFFLCPSEQHTKGVKYYCFKCHSTLSADAITSCGCSSYNINQLLVKAEQLGIWSRRRHQSPAKLTTTTTREINNNDVNMLNMERVMVRMDEVDEDEMDEDEETDSRMRRQRHMLQQTESVDLTGHYHWCDARNLEECLLNPGNMFEVTKLEKHIILCSLEFSPGSLRSFVLPLRISSLKATQLKTIVILVDDLKDLNREWDSVSHFPDIYVHVGSPLNRSVLRTLNIDHCHMFVVMSSLNARLQGDDSQALLITLNAKSICPLPVKEGPDRHSFLKLVRSLSYMRETSLHGASQPKSTIPILTELVDHKSTELLDICSSNSQSNEPFYCDRPYACGRVFISRVFDTLTTSIFFSPETFKLVRMFIAGTDSVDHELLLAEGIAQTVGEASPVDMPDSPKQCTILLLPLIKGILKPFAQGTFENMFTSAYTEFGIMCIGLYRLISLYGKSKTCGKERFVFTNPCPDLKLDCTDLVYCLCPPVLTLSRGLEREASI